MCIFSFCGQIVYGVVMLAVTVLTAVSLFTPGWTQIKGTSSFYNKGEGIMPWTCAKFTQSDDCDSWWKTIPSWQHIVILCMWIALVVEIFCLVWNMLVVCTCCFKKCLLHPIIPAAFLVSVLLAISVIVYGVNGKDFIAYSHAAGSATHAPPQPGQLGYSFWLAVVALILSAADVVIAVVTVCLGNTCL